MKTNRLDKYHSEKIQIVSFISIILVVFIHSYNLFHLGDPDNTSNFNRFIQDFISQGVARTAVPIFFSISGFLYFLNYKQNIDDIKIKFKKRTHTLLIPYLAWSLFGFMVIFVLRTLPYTSRYFKVESAYTISESLYTIFVNPVPYQLWFVRDLIVLVVISPLIYVLISSIKHYAILILLMGWVLNSSLLFVSIEGLLFFSVGGYMALFVNNFHYSLPDKGAIFFFTFWIAVVGLKTLLNILMPLSPFIMNLIHKLEIIVGIGAIWFLYDIKGINSFLKQNVIKFCSSFSFFIFAFHEPLLKIIKKMLVVILVKPDNVSTLIYFSAPMITISLSITLGYLLKNKIPKVYFFMTGGR